MNDFENQIQDAIEIVEAWELEGEDFSQAVNDQARLMAGLEFSNFCDIHHSAEPCLSHR